MTGLIMRKHMISYFDCPNCGYVQTESPFWLDEAYKSPINNSDTGLLTRNYQNSLLIYFLLILIFGRQFKKIRHVDYAGGYGVLVGLLREYKINSHWHDKYCKNLFSPEFSSHKIDQDADIVSAFEVFEHFENPDSELKTLLACSPNIIFTTRIIRNEIPEFDKWWYYGKAHGQHIGFYRLKTLKYIAKTNGLFLTSDGKSIHFLGKAAISSLLFKAICIISKISFVNILKRF
jgi:hypothetical protein